MRRWWTRFALVCMIFNSGLVVLASTAGTTMRGEGQIAYVSPQGQYYGRLLLLDIQRNLLVRLVPEIVGIYSPDWSADGQHLLFFVQTQPPFHLLVTRADGSDARSILRSNQRHLRMSWSPDGRQVMLDETGAGSFTSLLLLDVETGELIPLTSTSKRNSHPDWSPNGQQIVYQSNFEDNEDIYLMGVDGSNVRRLTHHPAPDYFPVWSPDGSRIVFLSRRDSGSSDLYLLDVNTLEERRLTNHDGFDFDPAWSPDGERIAFVSDRDGNYELYVMDGDGSNIRRLTYNPDYDVMPVWWP